MTETPGKYRSLAEEMKSVELFLTQKAAKSKETLSWNCTIDPEANIEVLVPATLVKSFVEHALLSDLLKQAEGRKIEISVHRTTLGMLIMISDNGSLQYQEYNRDRLIGNRLELLDNEISEFNRNQEFSINYQLLDVSYAEPGKSGTRVLITIVF